MVMPDYPAHVDYQERVSKAFLDQAHWTQMSILTPPA
jgi:hypothetical protein